MIGMPGPTEILIVFGIVFLLFGAKRIPKMANSFGRSLSEFKRGKKEGEKLLKAVEAELQEVTKPSVPEKVEED